MDINKDEYRPKLGIERGDRRTQRAVNLQIEHGILRTGRLCGSKSGSMVAMKSLSVDDAGPTAPMHVRVGVAQNRQQPRSRVLSVETVGGTVRAQQSLLDQVLGVGMHGGHRVRDSQQDRDFRLDVVAERLPPYDVVMLPECTHVYVTR